MNRNGCPENGPTEGSLMAAGVIFMQWDSYVGGPAGPAFFAEDPLTFNTRQERLHRLAAGDRLWLVSRCPDDGQYYIVAAVRIAQLVRNPPGSEKATLFGEYAVLADRPQSHDLGRRFPAEGLLRAFTFETGRPIKYGAHIGQSLQTLRLIDPGDDRLLDAALDAIVKGEDLPHAVSCGLWTKCDGVFADYFLKNWTRRREPLAFLLYDPPPALKMGAPVFIHSNKSLRLLARFREAQFVAGHKLTVEPEERRAERERVWQMHRAGTVDPPTKEEFDRFWEKQHGVRGLFLMDEVTEVAQPVGFKVYGRALGWGYPMGVGYRYLSVPQSMLLLRLAGTPVGVSEMHLHAIRQGGGWEPR
jgi:hypothetical protein